MCIALAQRAVRKECCFVASELNCNAVMANCCDAVFCCCCCWSFCLGIKLHSSYGKCSLRCLLLFCLRIKLYCGYGKLSLCWLCSSVLWYKTVAVDALRDSFFSLLILVKWNITLFLLVCCSIMPRYEPRQLMLSNILSSILLDQACTCCQIVSTPPHCPQTREHLEKVG